MLPKYKTVDLKCTQCKTNKQPEVSVGTKILEISKSSESPFT